MDPVIELARSSARLDDVAALKILRDACVRGVPDTGVDLAGLVSQHKIEVGLVLLGRPVLLYQHQEKTVEAFPVVKRSHVGNINIFHLARSLSHAACHPQRQASRAEQSL